MKHFSNWVLTLLCCLSIPYNAIAEEFKLKYRTNYLMPAYVNFKNDGTQYAIEARINVPLYNILFRAKGIEKDQQFHLLSYRDYRNKKTYAVAELDNQRIQYGKAKETLKTELLTLPTFDLFSLAFQLSYYDKLPKDFQTTNGKKLYPAHDVHLTQSIKQLKIHQQEVREITYQFKTGDKYITVKKWAGERFPRYIAYNRDGDNYELTFDRFEQ
ncbi:MAG: hypothetical protein Q4A60_08655 [Pasteurellaceae bacterium]|nr:hypothetical protein [Pasteurellaceae bacterium]